MSLVNTFAAWGVSQTLAAQVSAILRSYGTDAHVYLPGIGVINGLTAGNYLDSAGTTAATVDNPVGLVVDANGTINAAQATTANKPILRQGGSLYSWEFDGTSDSFALASVPFQQSDDRVVIAGYKNIKASGVSDVFDVSQALGVPIVLRIEVDANGTVHAYFRDDTSTLINMSFNPGSGINSVTSARVISGSRVLRINGVQRATNSTVLGATTVSLSSIGATATTTPAAFFQGNMFAIVAIKGTVTDADLLMLERFVGILSGVII